MIIIDGILIERLRYYVDNIDTAFFIKDLLNEPLNKISFESVHIESCCYKSGNKYSLESESKRDLISLLNNLSTNSYNKYLHDYFNNGEYLKFEFC
ncbi:hypothetical protein CTT30_12590 [Vibrio coralliilyticus]|nr:hypothetical protein CTT30_12590 [Vibrio coralliilyticus]